MSKFTTDYWIDRAAQMAGEIVEREFVSPEKMQAYRRACRAAGVCWIEQLDFMREFLGNREVMS